MVIQGYILVILLSIALLLSQINKDDLSVKTLNFVGYVWLIVWILLAIAKLKGVE